MSPLQWLELGAKAVGLVSDVVGLVRSRVLPWRWGHGYTQNDLDLRCIYCDAESVFKQRVTNPPCPGPDKQRAAEIKAAGGARYFRAAS